MHVAATRCGRTGWCGVVRCGAVLCGARRWSISAVVRRGRARKSGLFLCWRALLLGNWRPFEQLHHRRRRGTARCPPRPPCACWGPSTHDPRPSHTQRSVRTLCAHSAGTACRTRLLSRCLAVSRRAAHALHDTPPTAVRCSERRTLTAAHPRRPPKKPTSPLPSPPCLRTPCLPNSVHGGHPPVPAMSAILTDRQAEEL